MGKFFIIDGNSLINRAFYATPPLTNSEGQMTNAVYAFTNILLKLITEYKPAYLAVAFDMKTKTFRHGLYEGYKASRKGMPDDLASQLPLLKELLNAMGIAILEEEGFEADDIIGTLSKRFPEQTVIITGDRDALQLVDDSTTVFLTKRGLSKIQAVDKNNIMELFGLTPRQVIDFKALCGDPSDEIPGVKGVGEKTALSLLQKYGDLESIYKNIDEIPGKLREKLLEGREAAYLSRELATIRTDCSCCQEIESYTYMYPFPDEVRQAFKKSGFKSLLEKEHIFISEGARLGHSQMPAAQIIVISDEAELSSAVEKLMGKERLAVFFSSSINLCDGPTEYVIPISDTILPDAISFDKALNYLKPILEDEGKSIILFDIKSVLHRLEPYGARVANPCDDVCIMNYLSSSKEGAYDFGKIMSAEGYPKESPAFALYDMRERLLAKLERDNLLRLYREIEFPLIFILRDMELSGFKVDMDELRELSKRFERELELLTDEIYRLAGEQFNLNSPKQLSKILFEKLQLSSGKKTKSGLSTDFEVLLSLAGQHEIIPLIIRYRTVSKLKGTYIDGIGGIVRAGDMVHTEFKQAQTSTGRISSVEPNLQNIPVRDEDGRELRRIFIPREKDNILISADYSQIELRLLAYFSGDETLVWAFNNEQDIHAITASQVFNVPPEKVTPEMRRSAKAVNFGIIYGISNFGLANQLGIAPSRARVYIEKYFEKYSKVKEYMNENVRFAREHGYAMTITGRRRYIPELKSPNYHVRSFGERAAMNMPLQGSAADLIKMVMIRVFRRLKEENMRTKLILQVHDEIILDAPMCEKDKAVEIVKHEMENVMKLKIPLKVSVSWGKNWYEAK
ncbi:MAG: DNA polymerase I [Clostridiales bacterium]|jgi:DNA polymerase-1|nr:DNA polymerase I [Clostridiales bacterium]